jgi:hypothetical protein
MRGFYAKFLWPNHGCLCIEFEFGCTYFSR